MKKEKEVLSNMVQITHLFLDIGNVILTNGWDRKMRRRAASTRKALADLGLALGEA